MFPLLYFPFACGSPLSFSSLVCGEFLLLSFALFAFFFSSCFTVGLFFRLAFFGSFPLSPLCVCVFCCFLFFLTSRLFPLFFCYFSPVVLLFCWPIKTARNGPTTKNPDNGRNSANQRLANRANQGAFFVPIRNTGPRELQKERTALRSLSQYPRSASILSKRRKDRHEGGFGDIGKKAVQVCPWTITQSVFNFAYLSRFIDLSRKQLGRSGIELTAVREVR